MPGGRGGREGGGGELSSPLAPFKPPNDLWGPSFLIEPATERAFFLFSPILGALSGAAGQHQFPGLEEGDAGKVGLAGGICPLFDCYRPVPLLSRPGQTEEIAAFFMGAPAPGEAVSRSIYCFLALSWGQAEGGD